MTIKPIEKEEHWVTPQEGYTILRDKINEIITALQEEEPCINEDKVGFCNKCWTTHHGKVEEKCGVKEKGPISRIEITCQNPKGKCPLHSLPKVWQVTSSHDCICEKKSANPIECHCEKYQLGYEQGKKDEREKNIKVIKEAFSKLRSDVQEVLLKELEQ